MVKVVLLFTIFCMELPIYGLRVVVPSLRRCAQLTPSLIVAADYHRMHVANRGTRERPILW